MNGFTRQETLALTKTTSSRLAYLDRVGMVIPEKYGSNKKPTVIYSWDQVLEVIAISNLRQQVSLQTIRKMLDFFEKEGYELSLRDKHLVAVNDTIYWVNPDWSDMPNHIMQVAAKQNKDLGQLMLIVALPTRDYLIHTVWEAAEKSNIVDFESFKKRAKEKPANAA
jgi:hypothetical protein